MGCESVGISDIVCRPANSRLSAVQRGHGRAAPRRRLFRWNQDRARRGAGALHLAARPAAEAVRPAHRRHRRVYLLVYGYRQPARCTGASCGDAFRLRGMWRCRQWRRQIQGRYGTLPPPQCGGGGEVLREKEILALGPLKTSPVQGPVVFSAGGRQNLKLRNGQLWATAASGSLDCVFITRDSSLIFYKLQKTQKWKDEKIAFN